MTKPQKILAIMYELSSGHCKPIPYEEIVVKSFERYPADFQLRGYPQYPDSSDIHKPLYAMKKQGLTRSANKRFELTPKGLEMASTLIHGENGTTTGRLTKAEQSDITRITNSAGFNLFVEERRDEILDTDFYEYLGVSVRTPKNDFIGKLRSVDDAVKAYELKIADATARIVKEYHAFLVARFADEIRARM